MQKDNSQEKDGIIKELFKLGAHFGFSRARRHPSSSSFIYGFKNKTAVIDLEKTIESLDKACEFVAKIASEGKQVLFVGNKNEIRNVIKEAALKIDMPYVAERWIGGTFTNFKQIKGRVQTLKDYKDKQVKGGLDVYTKKERVVIDREIEKLERFFGSLSVMEKLPGAVVIVDVGEEAVAFDEALVAKIPVVGISSSDCDISRVAYPIVANDSSRESVKYLVDKLVSAYQEGKKLAKTEVKEKVAEVAKSE